MIDYLRARHVLLVLDNFEHLLDECTDLLLAWVWAEPGLALLITSREPLRAQGEWVIPLQGLSYPAEGERAGPSEAVQLFVQALRRVRPDANPTDDEVATISHICRLVEGMPLALELAARWARVYTLERIATEIARDLDFLVTPARDLPERHRSMRVIFEQSWQRLPPDEQAILAALSLFRGGFTVEAAQAVTGASLLHLAALMDRSLIVGVGTQRYEMHELLRQFAAEKRAAEPDTVRQKLLERHATFYRELLAAQADAFFGANPRGVIDRLRQDQDNIRRAWGWSVEHGTAADIAPSIKGLARFFHLSGQWHEGLRLLTAASERVEALLGEEESPPVRNTLAHLLLHRANFRFELDESESATELVTRAEALASGDVPIVRGLIHLVRAKVAYRVNDSEQARQEYERALTFLVRDDPGPYVDALYGLGMIHMMQGKFDDAKVIFERGLAAAEQVGYLSGVANHQRMIGGVLRQQGETDAALRAYQRALVAGRQSGDPAIYARVMNSLAIAQMGRGNYDEALELYETALNLCREIGWTSIIVMLVGNIGELHSLAGRWDEALAALEEACRLAEQMARPDIYANYRCTMAEIHRKSGRLDLAREGYEQALEATERSEHHRNRLNALSGLGDVCKDAGEWEEAIRYYERAINLQRSSNHRQHLCRTLINCAEAWYLAGDPAHAEPLLNEAQKLATEFGWDDLVSKAERVRAEMVTRLYDTD